MEYFSPEVSCCSEEKNGDAEAGRARWSRRTASPLRLEPFDNERSSGVAGGSSGQRRSGKGWQGSFSRRGTAGRGTRPLLCSWRASLLCSGLLCSGLLCSGLLCWKPPLLRPPLLEGPPPLLKAADDRRGAQLRRKLRRETSSGASSVRPGLFPDFDLGPRGRRSVRWRGFLQKYCLMGWAAGGPSNSGRREYLFFYCFPFSIDCSKYTLLFTHMVLNENLQQGVVDYRGLKQSATGSLHRHCTEL
jgi:hypothetical protein